MSMRIITGATGTAHVTSNDDGSINMGIFGAGNGVLKNGNKITATIIDNNTIRLTDGDIIMQGRVGRIDANTTEDIAISTGAVGENRNDLICVRYSMDTSTGYESMDLVVVEGTPSTSSATDPQYNTGDIRTGASIVDFPLYRVRLTGINIEGVDKLFDEIDTNASQTENINVLQENVETLNSNVDELNDQLSTTTKQYNVGDIKGVKSIGYDEANNKLMLGLVGADTPIPFSSGEITDFIYSARSSMGRQFQPVLCTNITPTNASTLPWTGGSGSANISFTSKVNKLDNVLIYASFDTKSNPTVSASNAKLTLLNQKDITVSSGRTRAFYVKLEKMTNTITITVSSNEAGFVSLGLVALA